MSKISKDLDKEVREASKNRCVYCLTPQILTSHKLEIEHIYPTSKGGNTEKENLCLACRHCNLHKSSKIYGFDAVSAKRVRLFNPNRQNGLNILFGTKIKQRLSAKLLADAQQFTP